MEKPRVEQTRTGWALKWVPWATLLGAAFVLAATLLHPITPDPWDADLPIRFIEENRLLWMGDHVLMTAGTLVWLGGLALCFNLFHSAHPLLNVVTGLLLGSIVLWMAALAFELGGLPITIARLHTHGDIAHRTMVEGLFASSLILGYFAMIPAWLGVTLGSDNRWGTLSGCVGLAGIVFSLFSPVLWILAITSAIPFLWTLVFAWRCKAAGFGNI